MLKGRAMVQAVSRRLLTAKDRFRSQANPCEIYDGQSGIRRGFSASTSAFPVSIIAPMLHNHRLHIARTRSLGEPSKKQRFFRKSGLIG